MNAVQTAEQSLKAEIGNMVMRLHLLQAEITIRDGELAALRNENEKLKAGQLAEPTSGLTPESA